MKKTHSYKLILTQLIFGIVVLLVSSKPIINLMNHLSSTDDIELLEDLDEEDTKKEIEKELDEFMITPKVLLTNTNVFKIQQKSKQGYIQQTIQMVADVPIPPPKFL